MPSIVTRRREVKTKRKAVSPGSHARRCMVAWPVSPAAVDSNRPSSNFPPVAVEHTSTLCIHARSGAMHTVPRMHVSRSRTAGKNARRAFSVSPHPCCRSLPRCAFKSPIGVCSGDDRQRRACHVRLAISQQPCILMRSSWRLGAATCPVCVALLSGTTVQYRGMHQFNTVMLESLDLSNVSPCI